MSDPKNRYIRQSMFAGIGAAGQRQLGTSSVAVVGCGALGSVSSEILVRAGIGKLVIIDRDFVELSNLQRQSLFTERHAADGMPKAVAARTALRGINSEIEIQAVIEDLSFENVAALLADADVVVDGTDNFETRFLLNDYCVKEHMSWIYGAALGSYGVSFAIRPGSGACLRCLFEELPPAGAVETCETAGIIGSVIHVIAAYQVTQAMRLIVGAPVSQRVLHVDLWKDEWRTISAEHPRADCHCCQGREFSFLKGETGTAVTRLCGRNAVQISPRGRQKVDFDELKGRLGSNFSVTTNSYLLRTEIEGCEFALFPDGRAIIKGTDDFSVARTLYSKYIGN